MERTAIFLEIKYYYLLLITLRSPKTVTILCEVLRQLQYNKVLSPPVVPRPWFSCRVTAIWCSTAQLPLRVEGSKTAPC